MNTTPEKILLIINPVSGRMKSTSGLYEILDELYRDDAVDTADAAEISLPLTESEAEKAPVKSVAKAPAKVSPLPSLASGNAGPLGGEPNPNRRVTVALTMHRGHATQLASAAAAEGYDTVICCGGDGTFNETVAGLMTIERKSRPVLGYIPAGSTNDFAASMGLSGTLREAARVTVSDHQTRIDIGHFRPLGMNHPPARHFSYIASFGVFTRTSYTTPQNLKNALGHTAYMLSGIQEISQIRAHPLRFTLSDGSMIEDKFLFGAISNSTSVGGILTLAPDRVDMADGKLELLLICAPRTLLELGECVRALQQKTYNCEMITFLSTDSLTVSAPEALCWTVDGEEEPGHAEIDVSCLHHAIQVITK